MFKKDHNIMYHIKKMSHLFLKNNALNILIKNEFHVVLILLTL